jgi:hypothetical protein
MAAHSPDNYYPKGTDTLTPFEKEAIRVFSTIPNLVPGQCNVQKVITEMQKPFMVCLRGGTICEYFF